ncbi:MAG: hypothetical protein GXX90_09105 [Microbacteriaceae bacterium]|nr:hypothetical protein [Microbacteriaceae bacterium]
MVPALLLVVAAVFALVGGILFVNAVAFGVWQFWAGAAAFVVAAAAMVAMSLHQRRRGAAAGLPDRRAAGFALLAVAAIVLGALAMSTLG